MKQSSLSSRRDYLKKIGYTAALPFISACAVEEKPIQEPPIKTDKPKFLFSLNTSTIKGQQLGFMEEIEITAKAGYDAIEIWINGLQKYLEEGGSLQDLNKKLKALNLEVVNAIGFAQWIVDDENTRNNALAQLKKEMDMLAEIGCKRIAAPPAGATKEPGLDLNKAGDRFQEILNLGKTTGVIPQLEVWGFSANLNKLSEVLYVAAEADIENTRILPDIYHLYKGNSGYNSIHLLNPDAIDIFHLNDVPASIDSATIEDKDRVYPGDGIAPINKVLSHLAKGKAPTILSLELFNPEYWKEDALSVAEKGLQKMQQLANQIA
ncbi:MAG: sugar phosphate isomerase/epimerase family protein [Bacteroidota bacterium]